MKILTNILYYIAISLVLISCEDIIDPNLPEASPVFVIDAWINNKSESQVIKVKQTLPYFDTNELPGISGAEIRITDSNGNSYDFIESEDSSGDYLWTPPNDSSTFGEIGMNYFLSIKVGEITFESISSMNRVPSIDSVTYRFEKGNDFFPDSYFAQFYAVDPVGIGDSYWIKAYKNGIYLSKPDEINIAYDAAFSAGSEVDGITFLQPIRDGINPFDQDENDDFLSPYAPGDSVYVEIYSITNLAHTFLTQMQVQINRPGGFAEMFSVPLSNVITNIINTSTDDTVIGFFNVSAVSGMGSRLDPEDLPTEEE